MLLVPHVRHAFVRQQANHRAAAGYGQSNGAKYGRLHVNSCRELLILSSAIDKRLLASGPPSLKCELVRDFARLEELSEDWEALARRTESEIFQQFSWVRAFWKGYGSKLSLCTLVVHGDTQLVGILPLACDGGIVRFLAEGDYNDLISEEHNTPAVLAAALQGLFSMPLRWDSCVLNNLSADSRIVRHWPALPPALRHKAGLHFACPCPTIVRQTDADTFTRLAQKDSLRRHENKLKRQGQLTFRHLESRQEILDHLPRFFEHQIARRALLGQRSHFQNAEHRLFYAALVDELDPAKELRFSALELEGRPIAYHFGFQWNAKLLWYQSGFDVDLWQSSPGEVLIRKLLQYAHAAALREFDFTIGGEAYKNRFANLSRINFVLRLERRPYSVAGAYRRSAAWAGSVARQIREDLRSRPRVYNALKKTFSSGSIFWSAQQALYRRRGLLRYLSLAFGAVFRSTIFSRDEALVCSIMTGPSVRSDAHSGSQSRITPCGLSDLAVLSVDYPDELPRSKLGSWMARLSKGERLYGVRSAGKLTHLAWTAVRPAVLIREFSDTSLTSLSAPAMVVERCWSARDVSASHSWARALGLLAQEIGDGREVWTYCLNTDREMQRELESVGFQLRNRVVQIRLVHMFRWNRIVGCEPLHANLNCEGGRGL